jgi:predicted transcriptional regulator
MEQTNIKDRMIQTLQDLPDDVTFESAMDRLYLMYKVERGIAQMDAGQKVPHEEARKRILKWLE